ncbi:AAA domain-containing protein [Caulobacter sp. NIBR1757]|uniref:AAA domain-containing protein n=1 Tax=Caulobacter sp. NIBR1757 TaxID=3016000 RepID=UPI0022F0342C|nr:AAA domain-containing protein [Caulobacter sp. NIBR1757]WGM37497.1 hypothetical protein AMEJIAPC_00395 [Caulobacter sp. NIBR1757]
MSDTPLDEPVTLRTVSRTQRGLKLPTDDVLFCLLPLLRQVAALHGHGRVAELGPDSLSAGADGILGLKSPDGRLPRLNIDAVRRVQPSAGSALNIVGELRVTIDAEDGQAVEDLLAQTDADAPVTKPVYLPDLAAWEHALGHHDEITDIFQLGLILASLACGLDFGDENDLKAFAARRDNLFSLNGSLNPVIAGVILEMTALNRHQRATDLNALIGRLETWRDQPVGLEVQRVLAAATGVRNRRTAVLSHLRDRLFDLSRRNRLLHFKPTQASVNLTVASVPMVLRIESIKPEQLCTWGGAFAQAVTSGKPMALQSWLRFEDQPYLPGSLDRLIQETRRDRADYGFSNLRLVVAFLRWNNLKEAPDERILSPLLWLPVTLVKKKGVRDQYILEAEDGEAEFNPALRHHLRQLYDIRLPETVDLNEVSVEQIHADLQAQIRQSEPGVELRLQTKPAIQLIHQKAVQRLRQFQKGRGRAASRRAAAGKPDFSYDRADYRPLGLALFRQRVQPSALPLRGAVGASFESNPRYMVAPASEIEHATFSLPQDDGHRYAWDFDLTQVTLANLNYRKMSLVRDYSQLVDEGTENPAFDRIFSIEPRDIETGAPPAIPLAEQWNVIAADATQTAAVALSRTGRSFIIQGPPGTGKSQTITNLIADYAARGKRVLFVCEKRAALDVVFHRLRQAGLDDLCCLIHDSQTDKKAFVLNLKDSYERWTKGGDRRERLLQGRGATVDRLAEALDRIERFEQAMRAAPESLGGSVRALLHRAMELPPPDGGLNAVERERLPTHGDWRRHRGLISRLYQQLAERTGSASLAAHPFARLSGALLANDQAFGAISRLLDALEALLDELDPVLEDSARLISADTGLEEAAALAEASAAFVQSGLAGHLALLDPTSTAAADLRQARAGLQGVVDRQSETGKAVVHWREPLSPDDTQSALAIARRLEPSFLKVFNPGWWKLKGEIGRRYDFSQHAVQTPVVKVLEGLAADQAAVAALSAERAGLAARYGVRDLDALLAATDDITARLPGSPLLRRLKDRLAAAPDPAAAARAEAAAGPALANLKARAATLDLPAGFTLGALAEWVRDMREGLDDLVDLIPVLGEAHRAGPAVIGMLQSHDLPMLQLEAQVVAESLARLLRRDPELARFDARALAEASQRALRAERRLFDQNAEAVRATLHRQFLDNVKRAALSVTQLDERGKAFKKRYAGGRRELEHEFGKSMRYRSVRELASGDSGLVINDLKPIWLMSPLSVSDTLPLVGDLFDVVIFDEASQIPTEEAVPALSRARQVVIVGDEMQLPPTSFFSAALDEEDEQVAAEEDGERITISLDADSLLSQSARNLPATLLAWHYRSRYESLISFSNAAFYEGRLITIPDRDTGLEAGETSSLRSDDEAAAARGADALMARPLSYHRIEDGVYLARGNQPEAHYIAGLVRELLKRETGLSLGIVAFSEAQQGEIEDALEALAEEDADFAARLEREYVREDDDQFNGLFVKNLENVQGDERDIILLSICYAPGPDGRMLMNFGPINQRGGEKRLNVIFSRAKHRMAVISTIGAEAITNTHNDGAAALKAFLSYAEASARGEADRSQSVLAALNPGARDAFALDAPADVYRAGLARALRRRGHAVDEHVGRSQFRCDLAIRDPAGGGYALGVLLDGGPAAAGEVRERYVFRPAVLAGFGWRLVDIPSADWVRNPEGVIARIEARLAGQDDPPLPDDDDEPEAVQPEPEAPADETVARLAEGVREFRFQEGGSNKFWRIGAQGLEVTVAYGRIGTKGQVMVKTWDTPERARREVDKLVEEKLRKGYQEVEV